MIFEHLQNTLTRPLLARYRTGISLAFPQVQNLNHVQYLCLRPYVTNRPERFFDRSVMDALLHWCQQQHATDRRRLKRCLSMYLGEIDRAIFFLREASRERWHDTTFKLKDDVEVLRFIDRNLHPAYVRLVEGVIIPILRPAAYLSRLDRGAGIDGLNVWNVVQELAGGPLEQCTRPYRHIVRNGIAHGGLEYTNDAITYRDQAGKRQVLSIPEVVRLVDDLVDTCHGAVAAMKLFFLERMGEGYPSLQELLLDELREETMTSWWTIEACLPSRAGQKSQLIVYARPNSRDVAKVQWSCIQSGILAERFAPGYDRYLLSLRTPKALPGWAAFDGKKLRRLREAKESDLAAYRGILENNLIFYVPTPALPRWLGRIGTLCDSITIHWSGVREEYKKQLEIPDIVPRSASIHRNGWRCVLNGKAVIEDLEADAAPRIITSHRRRIIRAVRKAARKELPWYHICRWLPVGFAQVALFQRDHRKRRLANYGLGTNLVCTLRMHRIKRIRSPDIAGSTVYSRGPWRVAWNAGWLDATGVEPTALEGWRPVNPVGMREMRE